MPGDSTLKPKPVPLLYIVAPLSRQPVAAEDAVRRGAGSAGTVRQTALEERRTYYETADWRLYGAERVLFIRRQPDPAELRLETTAGLPLRRLSKPQTPSFAWDLPPGPLRNELSPIIEMRRLLPLVEVRAQLSCLQLLDRHGKTVLRVQLEERKVRGAGSSQPFKALPPALRLLPVAGYDRVYARMRRHLEGELDLEPVASELEDTVAVCGRRPFDYSSKLAVELEAEMRTNEALRRLLLALAGTLRRNEAGTRDDLDSEFLHDFRVAVRRTRCALSQIRQTLPKGPAERYRRGFRWLGELTGPTRDLDVWLLRFDDDLRLLPEDQAVHLEPLREHLLTAQRAEQARLAKGLQSPRYRKLVEGWEDFLTKPAGGRSSLANAARPAIAVASDRIWRLYRRLLRRGAEITETSPAPSLHQLRLDAKKLRYLMELFRSLYDDRKIRRGIRTLKRLQDNLGQFNDLVVHQGMLAGFARELAGSQPVETQMAIGVLIDRLRQAQEEERRRFAECFDEFSAAENRRAFRNLFKAHATPGEGSR